MTEYRWTGDHALMGGLVQPGAVVDIDDAFTVPVAGWVKVADEAPAEPEHPEPEHTEPAPEQAAQPTEAQPAPAQALAEQPVAAAPAQDVTAAPAAPEQPAQPSDGAFTVPASFISGGSA